MRRDHSLLNNGKISVQFYNPDHPQPSLQIPPKKELMLNREDGYKVHLFFIERGLTVKDADDKTSNLLDAVPKETLQELSAISEDCLKKAGLTELSEKLNSFGGEK